MNKERKRALHEAYFATQQDAFLALPTRSGKGLNLLHDSDSVAVFDIQREIFDFDLKEIDYDPQQKLNLFKGKNER